VKGVRVQRHAPAALYHRRLGGLQGRSGQVRKISPPPGFDPRTVQPVASRYTDYATHIHSVDDANDWFNILRDNSVDFNNLAK